MADDTKKLAGTEAKVAWSPETLEAAIRRRIRETIETVLEAELEAALGAGLSARVGGLLGGLDAQDRPLVPSWAGYGDVTGSRDSGDVG